MDRSLQAQVDSYLPYLQGLIHRGRAIRDRLAADPSSESALASNRLWQQDCAMAVSQLSGGSKVHWLARAYGEAFLMRSTAGRAVETVAPADIASRIIEVIEQAVESLSQMRDGQVTSQGTPPAGHRFDFVHNPELRPIVEQAYSDGRSSLEQGRFGPALFAFCGVLEAIVTDALEHKGLSALAAEAEVPADKIAGWSFDTRLEVAEKVGLIRGGCARLPPIARRYRDLSEAGREDGSHVTVSEQEARQAGQVLRVVMRDLDPGR
ncbi:MAG TPA: hypothetical protein VEV17_16685 [Bryobacteraceae bacterium]|nr:hypothetical protein [Bryobacteraceae bacterium]